MCEQIIQSTAQHTHTHSRPRVHVTGLRAFNDNLTTVRLSCYFSQKYIFIITRRNRIPRSRSMSDTQRPRSMSLPAIHQSECRNETRNTNQNANNLHAHLLDVAKHYKCLHCQKPLNRIKLISINKGKHTRKPKKRVEEMLPRTLFDLRTYNNCNMSIHFKVKGISV